MIRKVTSPSAGRDHEGVALVAPVTVPYVRYSEHGAPWFIGKALSAMLQKAGLDKSEIDGLSVSSFSLAPDTPPSMAEYFALEPRWLEHVPMGGASGVVAMRRAARAVQCGDAEVVACIAGDTNRRGAFKDLVANFSSFSRDAVYPYGAAGPNAVFAMITDRYMREYGTRREDFGRICIAQRENAMHFPHALLRELLTMEQYLGARPIAEPLHLYDCVMPCAGGEGFLVMSIDKARALNLPFAVISAAIERHNAFREDDVQLRGGWEKDRETLYAAASKGPDDIDFLQTYDDYPVIVMLQLEGLGFCPRGEAAKFVRETSLTCDEGGLPHNTSGGQLSVGQAGSGGGFLGMVEALRQLTGQGLGSQVQGARTGLVSGYGMVNYDRGLCTAAAILEAGQA